MSSSLKIKYSQNARRDLFVESVHLESVGDLQLAQRFVEAVARTVDIIQGAPGIGRVVRVGRGDKPEIRRLTVSGTFNRQIVYYALVGDILRIERVLNGSRSVVDIFP